MDSNEERVQKQVVVNSPGQRREVLTERTERGPRLSPGTIAIIAILARPARGWSEENSDVPADGE